MLTISRDDISSTELTEYPADTRFIKLPIDRYLSLLEVTPIAPQVAFINAVNNPKYRFVCGALARRIGKTFASNIIAQLTALIPGCNVLIMSPNYSLSEISFTEQRKLLKQFSVEVARDNSKDRIIELENGSTIRMGSVNQVDSCVGRSYNLILFDECALSSEGADAFNVALRPTLDRPGSKAIFISTPRGKNNWFSEFYGRGFLPEYTQWASIHADYRENPRLTEEDIRDARLTMSRATFSQEYEASFTAFEGQIFQLNQDECLADLSELNTSEMEVFAGIDIGFKDPTAFIIVAYDYNAELYYVIDEYLQAEKTTDGHARAIKEMMDKYHIDSIFIDHSAAQTRFDWAYNFDIPTISANKSVLDGIAHCQNIVEHGRLIVNNSCKHTIQMLDQYRWDDKTGITNERPKHDKYSHMADAMRYALYTFSSSTGTI